ncbi:CUB and sushi domain-containing protein 1 [Stylophora pistillata]|uniref:CUB and sushi domain-containing protein 1 n=1 Tax=Stylophora pistillata TaxID=50429 RepID=A0A2B4SZ82_STYPI|nr:CUB and sushi domain-containing protein 1 [Stylophora pistillata]
MKYDSLEVGQKVTYTCSPGFIMEGRSTLTCARTGTWNRVEPKCVCKRNNREPWKFCKKGCNPGTAGNCKNNQECICDGDCGYSCVLKALECGRPSKLENGKHKYSSRRLGSVVKYQCNEPYTLIGPKKRTCRGIRRWDGTDPLCKIICKDPGNVVYSTKQLHRRRNYEEDYLEVGDRVEYKCFPGFEMEGSKDLICGSKGEWNKDKPKCKLPTCDPPRLSDNADFRVPSQKRKRSFNYQEKVLLKCRTGYYQNGMLAINCGRLSTPHKASIVSETHTGFGGYVKYQCKEKGYELIGSETRVCQNDEQWSGVKPSCQIVNCGDPGTPANGKRVHITNGFHYGSSVKFACDANYSLEGSEKITCEETKEWSSFIPRCRASCSNPGVPVNGEKKGDDFKHEKTITFRCHEDYERVGGETIQCIDGKWSAKIPQCKVISCGDPGTPKHGRQTKVGNNFSFRGTVAFQCNDGYTLFGKSSLSCQRSKMWDGDVPKCLASCSDPGHPRYGITIGSGFEHDSVVNFKCLPYRVLEGASESKCVNGRWTAQLPNCKDCNESLSASMTDKCQIDEKWTLCEIKLRKKSAITAASIQPGDDRGNVRNVRISAHSDAGWVQIVVNCGDPGTPANGKRVHITNGFHYGSSVKFACDANYSLEGSGKITCEETKEWSSFVPRCRASCSDPGEPVNGDKRGDDFKHGKTITFRCHDDYERVGGETIQCIDGKWSAKLPQCKVISCGDPGTPQHGRQTKVVNNFAFRGTVAFQCDDGYTLLGKSFLSCQRSKMWDGDVPKCLASCDDPGHLRYGITIGSGFEHDSVVNFKCLPYRVLKGASQSKCVNGRWTAQLPNCKGCIIPGSAVLFKEGGKYHEWRFASVQSSGEWEVVKGKDFKYISKDNVKNVILDEKPTVSQLLEGTVVVGKDLRGNLKKGKIKRPCSSTQCIIETNGKEWQSELENVRVSKGELCK